MTAAAIPFKREMSFEYGEAMQVSPLVRRIVARNPGNFTLHGTNSYIIGRGTVAVIDPGPAIDEHVDALVAAVRGETVSHILVTHTHMDHSPAAAALQQAVGGEILGAIPREIPDGTTPSESIQYDFAPDRVIADDDAIEGDGWTLGCVHTPGHMSNHFCFALAEERALFSGDHVMGWNTSIVSPPDGNMAEYMASLKRCIDRDDAVYWPGHGPDIANPRPFVRGYLGHRRLRESEIARCLTDGIATIPEMVAVMYRHLPETMHRAASRAVFAHLEHMVATGRAACDGPAAPDSIYRKP